MLCPNCKTNLAELRMNNEDIKNTIVCNICGISYKKLKKTDKKKLLKGINNPHLTGNWGTNPAEDTTLTFDTYLGEDGGDI